MNELHCGLDGRIEQISVLETAGLSSQVVVDGEHWVVAELGWFMQVLKG